MIDVLLVLACGPALQAHQAPLQGALELSRRGAIRASWTALEALADPLDRAQARVQVLADAGDLEGALAAAQAALPSFPGDAWLHERATALAVSLRRGRAAAEELARFERTLGSSSAMERERWQAVHSVREREVAELLALELKAQRAGWLARATVGTLVLLVFAGAYAAWMRSKKDRPDEAWARQGG